MPSLGARTLPLFRLIVRPLFQERLRTLLTVAAVGLGVAVVIGIDLASEASADSFQSSMESLQGSADFEIHQVGGIPEELFGRLSRLDVPVQFSASVEGFAVLAERGVTVPLFGLDLIGDPRIRDHFEMQGAEADALPPDNRMWASALLGLKPGESVDLVIQDQATALPVAGTFEADALGASQPDLLVMDIAMAQRVLGRTGILDRIYVDVPPAAMEEAVDAIRSALPPTASLSEAGVQSAESRRMLRAFKWNLRMLSYISLIVGAFLIHNTVSTAVVRRRSQIAMTRALGATRGMVTAAFLFEGAVLGTLGVLVGVPLGRLMAGGAIATMGQTVEALYVSSVAAPISLNPLTVAIAAIFGIGVSTLAAWLPAREAASVPPAEGMAKARCEYIATQTKGAWAWGAAGLTAAAIGLCYVPAVDRIPVAGYLACLAFVGAAAMLAPQVSTLSLRLTGRVLALPFGVAGFLGARSLAAALARTAVIVAALSTATAMMVSVGVMVGSFRETVVVWMDGRLQADLYVAPAGPGGSENAPTMSDSVTQRIAAIPEVEAVDGFREHRFSYRGLPATLGLGDISVQRSRDAVRYLAGPEPSQIWDELESGGSLVASETFASKHGLDIFDTVALPLGDQIVPFRIAGIFSDYSSEAGYLIGDRTALLRYLPDRRITRAAIYLEPDAEPEAVRGSVLSALQGSAVTVARSGDLRRAP